MVKLKVFLGNKGDLFTLKDTLIWWEADDLATISTHTYPYHVYLHHWYKKYSDEDTPY